MTALLGLDVAGRLVLVAGGGPVAERRVRALLAQGARVRVVAPGICAGLAALAAEVSAAGRLEWRRRVVRRRDLRGVWLVHTATGRPDVDARVAAWAAARRVWCVNAGSVTAGSARTPAVAHHDDLLLAVVSTGPADPGRSARVRDAMAARIDGGEIDLRRRRPGSGRVILVGGGPGDPDLITVRGRRALAAADVVVADRLGPVDLLRQLPRDVEVIDVGKSPGHHPVPQDQINAILVDRARAGQVVVRLKGGDPYLLGRGGEEVLACQAAGVPVSVIPGVSSALAVPAAAGIPVTHRGVSAGVHVVTGHGGLGPSEIAALRTGSATVVILMGVATLAQIARAAITSGVAADLPVAVVERGTLPDQRVTRTSLAEVAEGVHEFSAPAVIVIGEVAALDLSTAGAAVTMASPKLVR